jgi:hypothetical protein
MFGAGSAATDDQLEHLARRYVHHKLEKVNSLFYTFCGGFSCSLHAVQHIWCSGVLQVCSCSWWVSFCRPAKHWQPQMTINQVLWRFLTCKTVAGCYYMSASHFPLFDHVSQPVAAHDTVLNESIQNHV